jgi:hypothetical protein
VVQFVKKGFEEFERHMTLKMNEEKLRVNTELNVRGLLSSQFFQVQAEMAIKMIEEFRLRLNEMEHLQNKLNASVDVLDIRTKGGVGQQIQKIPSPRAELSKGRSNQ